METIELTQRVGEAADFTKKLMGLVALGVVLAGAVYVGQTAWAWGQIQYANFLQYAVQREFGGLDLEVADEKGKLKLVNARELSRQQLETSLVWLMQDRIKVQYAFEQAEGAFKFYQETSDEGTK